MTAMRVCLIANNPCTNQAQLFREAQALAADGYSVELIGWRDSTTASHDERDGFTITRIGRDPLDSRVKRFLGRPLRIVRVIAGTVKRPRPAVPSQPVTAQSESARQPRPHRRTLHHLLNILDFSLRVRRYTKRHPAAIYHVFNLDMLPLGVALARRDGAPLVYDSRELYYDRALVPRIEKPFWRLIERALIGRADQVVTPCESFADELVRRYGVEKPAVVMSCPTLPDRQPNGAAERLRERASLDGSAEPIVLYQGKIQAERGLGQLIAAAGRLERGVVVIMGDGTLKPWLEETIEKSGLQSRVRTARAVPPNELLSYTAGASIGVAPIEANHLSQYYSSPNKLFEYLAVGLPVVATRLPELERVINEHEVGLLCDPGDAEGLAEAIDRLLGDPEMYERMRRNAFIAAKIYNWEMESQKLILLYRELEPRDPAATAG